MKRVLAFMLAFVTVLCLAACKSAGEQEKPSNVSTGDGDTTEAADTSDPTGDSGQAAATKAPWEPSEAAIQETVVFDAEGIKVTAKSLDLSGFMGPQLKLLIENDSGKGLTFQCADASINGYMVETIMSVSVASGKKVNDSLTFIGSDLTQSGIQAIADIAFSLHIFESDSWQTFVDTDTIVLKTSFADGFSYTFDDSGDVAYDDGGIRIVVKGLDEGERLVPGVVIYICNESDHDITVQVRDFIINSFMVQTVFSADVLSGKHRVASITFLSAELEENDIASIENIALSFHIFDKATWSTIADTDTVKIDF